MNEFGELQQCDFITYPGYSTIYSLRLRDSRDSQDSETPETPRLPRLRDSRGFCHITFQFSFISDLQQNSETPKTPSGALVLIKQMQLV